MKWLLDSKSEVVFHCVNASLLEKLFFSGNGMNVADASRTYTVIS